MSDPYGALRARGAATRRRIDDAFDSVSPSPARRVRETIVAAGMQELFQPSDFDPDFDDVNVFMDDIEVLHDGAKPGSLSDHGKIAGLVKFTTNEDVRQAVRDLRTDGYTDSAGDHHDWIDVTWDMARKFMVHLFG